MNRDILSDVLRSVRLRGALYFHVSGSRDWAAEAPPSREIAKAVMPGSEHVIEFHALISGAAWGATIDGAPVRLEAGDVILFPHGDPHVISSAPGMRASVDPASYFAHKGEPLPFLLHLDAQVVRLGGRPPGLVGHDAGVRLPRLRPASVQSPDRLVAPVAASAVGVRAGLGGAMHAPGGTRSFEHSTRRGSNAGAPQRNAVHQCHPAIHG
jgi:hypothetical protein